MQTRGPDDPTTEDGPCLAPSTPLSHALTILGRRHQCAVKVKVDFDSKSLNSHHAPVMGTLTISDKTSVARCSFMQVKIENKRWKVKMKVKVESESGSKI